MSRKLNLLASVCLALALGFSALPAYSANAIKIVVEGTYPPWNTQDSGGKLGGFDVDVANEVCKRAKLECEIVAQNWDSQIPSLLAGQFDAMMTVGPTPKRLKVMMFSTPYAATPESFAVMTSGPLKALPSSGAKIFAEDDTSKPVIDEVRSALKGKKVGVVGSSSLQDFLESYFKDGVEIRTYKSSPDALLDMKSGRIDAMFDSSAFLRGAAQKEGNEDLVLTGPLFSGKTLATTVCFGLRPDETDLKAKFDVAIASAAADGTIKGLSEKWFKFDVSP